jgi:polyhydroxyalkanoate synthesis regulator protein
MSEIHYPQYRAFQQSLEEIEPMLQEQFNHPSSQNQSALIAALSDVQQLFKEQILTRSLDQLPGDMVASVQSYRTEIHKQMRLLETDVMFFQTARQPATRQQRLSQMSQRLKTLIGYCDALLES